MPYQVSTDSALQREMSTPLWEAIYSILDEAIPTTPLSSDEHTHYVRSRIGDDLRNIEALRSHLPRAFDDIELGPTELDVISFLANKKKGRVLVLTGPRGVGKTSLLHFAAHALRRGYASQSPSLLIVNCLQLDPAEATTDDLVRLLRLGLMELAQKSSSTTNDLFEKAAKSIVDSDPNSAADAFAELQRKLPQNGPPLLTIAYDNLEPLRLQITDQVLQLARNIYLASNIGSIVCLRPGSLRALQAKVNARAFFHCHMRVRAPSVQEWLSSLPRRCKEAARLDFERNGRYRVAHGVELNEAVVETVMERFCQLLLERRDATNALQIIQSASSEDTRHLLLLVRRILAHRNLPDRWLLGIEKEYPIFHPVPSLLEAGKTVFKHSLDIPNILSFILEDGTFDILLPYRILSLLNYPQPIALEQLTRDLATLGYATTDILKCIRTLYSCHLAEYSDADPPEDSGPQPEAATLTSAGVYYFNHFSRTADYLAYTVLDVPLQHRRIQQERVLDRFEPKLLSLIEYSESARRYESQQLRMLQNQQPSESLRRIADALAHDGLLIHAISAALNEVKRRSTGDILQFIKSEMHELEAAIANSTRVLHEISNRGRRGAKPSEKSAHAGNGLNVLLRAASRGDSWSVDAELKLSEPCHQAFISLASVDGSGPSALATEQFERNGHSLRASFPCIEGGLGTLDASSAKVAALPPSMGRVACLSATARRDNGTLDITLDVLSDASADRLTLGSGRSLSEIERWSKEAVAQVASRSLKGKPFEDRISAVGIELARQTLTPEGINLLASNRGIVDTLIIHSSSPLIPWEWLSAQPLDSETAGAPTLCDSWNCIRWPQPSILVGVWKVLFAERSNSAAPLRTFGISGNSWHGPRQSTVRALIESFKGAGTVHIVGHANDNGTIEIFRGEGSDPLELDAMDCRILPWNVSGVLLSSCSTGSAPYSENICAAIADAARAQTWAPIVPITLLQAKKIDQALHTSLQNGESFNAFMRRSRGQIPELKLYVQYGVYRG